MRPVMARLAAAFYGYPARDLLMIGVTGTNGKTTVTQLLGDLLGAHGPAHQRDGDALGRADDARGDRGPAASWPACATGRSPTAPRHAVAMEVSSHALVQSRVEGIHFDVAVFTNLSHDHLDYHGTMEEYFEAKAIALHAEHALRGVVHADDPWGQRLLERARIPTVAVHHGDADRHRARARVAPTFTWRGQRITHAADRCHQRRQRPAGGRGGAGPRELDLEPEEIAAGHGHLSPVPGRLQVIAGRPGGTRRPGRRSPPFTVLVDYAHTPAGLEVVLGEARTAGRPAAGCSCVFGCGGNRDRAKRPLMGDVAERAERPRRS